MIRLVAQPRISLQYSPPDRNKMDSRFVPVTDEQMFVLNVRSCGFAKHEESHKILFNSVQRYYLKLLLINAVLFTTISGAEIQIILKIFSLLFGHFCRFVMVHTKTTIHLSVGEKCKDILR